MGLLSSMVYETAKSGTSAETAKIGTEVAERRKTARYCRGEQLGGSGGRGIKDGGRRNGQLRRKEGLGIWDPDRATRRGRTSGAARL